MVLGAFGRELFLDRYALKRTADPDLGPGDYVFGHLDPDGANAELGMVVSMDCHAARAVVRRADGRHIDVDPRLLDKVVETEPAQLWTRLAMTMAAVEQPALRAPWQDRFRALLDDWCFVPGGRVMAGAGTGVPYSSCYVLPGPRDSRRRITDRLAEMAELMAHGAGVGMNISALRPRLTKVEKLNGRSSGAVSWAELFSFTAGLIGLGGTRRGALMLVMEAWHPDILEFIAAKRGEGRFSKANLSVGLSDAFMEAVHADGQWELAFPDTTHPAYDEVWDGDLEAWRKRDLPVVSYRRLPARQLWRAIAEAAWACGEPGVFFLDRYNGESNSWYLNPIRCSNPCAEQGLPDWGSCNLGAIHLGRMVGDTGVDWAKLGSTVRGAVRFLDNVIDATPYVFEELRNQQMMERRIGLGTMGLAEMMLRLGIRYGGAESLGFVDRLFHFICREAYGASIDLAKEKGAFAGFQAEPYLKGAFMRRMPEDIRAAIARHGIRNVTVLSQAPTGSIGSMVGTSTGIEPYFSWTWRRFSRLGTHEERVPLYDDWLSTHPGQPLPDHFITAHSLPPEDHVRLQAAVQRWIDSSVSKTCNLPSSAKVEDVMAIYSLMYESGCKGGTIYRDQSRNEQVLCTLQDGECTSCV
jgi:ribonucleoside-diphosphate reductase alpha chain